MSRLKLDKIRDLVTYEGSYEMRFSFKISFNMFETYTDFCWPFNLWIFCYVSCLSSLSCIVSSLQPCGHIMGRTDLLAFLCVMFSCVFATFT